MLDGAAHSSEVQDLENGFLLLHSKSLDVLQFCNTGLC